MNHITVQQLVNALVGLGGVVGALTALGTFFYVVLFRPFRNFLRKEIVSSLTNIDETLKRTEGALNAHIANPVAHHLHGELYDQSETGSAKPQSSVA
jgi:hypothetical protein